MRILTCFISPTGGTAKVHGFDVFNDPLEVRRRLGYLPQRAPLYQDMSVWDYLEFASQIRGLEASTFKSRLKKVVEVCGLGQVLRREGLYSSHLSQWRQQRRAGQLAGLQPQKRGRPSDPQADEVSRLQQENERLKAQLVRAELIIEAQKKLCQLLNLTSSSLDEPK
jgi:transposase-like protein